MPRARAAIPILLVLFTSLSGVFSVAAPSVTITDPHDGAILLDHDINVTGTCSDNEIVWSERASNSDFDNGTKEDVVTNVSEWLQLQRNLLDDFNDDSLNSSKWSVTKQYGLTVSEESKGLHFEGKSTTRPDYWDAYCYVESGSTIKGMVSADLKSFSGSGSGYATLLVLRQDSNTYAAIGQQYDLGAFGNAVYVVYSTYAQGSFYIKTVEVAKAGAHNYMLKYESGKVFFYQDGVERGNRSIALSSIKVQITTGARNTGDSLDAVWDDVMTDHVANGTYTSLINDTGSSDALLGKVEWSGTFPSATSVGLEVRTGDSTDLGDATGWTQVANGQTQDLPALKRYVQFRANLSTTNSLHTPSIKNVSLTYRWPVTSVEVSMDGGDTWSNVSFAGGQWNTTAILPENRSVLMARVTDVAGSVRVVSITVDVDTTPPTGMMVIENGDDATATTDVHVQLDATDQYGVTSVMLSEDPTFAGAVWVDYGPTVDWTLSSGEGDKTLYCVFKDTSGWTSDVVNDTIVLDTHGPVGSITIDDGAEFANRSLVDLWLHAVDLLGVVEMRIGTSPDLSGEAWRSFEDEVSYDLPGIDGEKWVYAQFRDPLGQVSDVVGDSIVLDTTPPVVVMTLNGGADFTNSYQVLIDLSIVEAQRTAFMRLGEDPDLSDRGPLPVETRLEWTLSVGDGLKTLYVRVWDAAGNAGPAVSASIFLDTTGPIMHMTVNYGNAFTNQRDVHIKLWATESTEVTEFQLSEDPDFTGCPTQDFVMNTTFQLSEGDGTKTLHVRGWDIAGNMGSVVTGTVNLDTVGPMLTIIINDGERYTNSSEVSIGFTASDMFGVRVIQISEYASLADALYEPFTSVRSWVLSDGDGTHTVYAQARDMAGNVGLLASDTIILDTIAPVVGISVVGGSSYTNITTVQVEIEVTEDHTLGSLYIVEVGLQPHALPLALSGPVTFELTKGDGPKSLLVRAIDLAGNVGESEPVSIVLDTTPPNLTLEVGDGSGFVKAREVELVLKASDSTGVVEMVVGEGADIGVEPSIPFTNVTMITLSPGYGEKAIAARVRDAAGNWCPPVRVTFVLDTVVPETLISASLGGEGSSQVTVSWSGMDMTSGVGKFDVQYRDGSGPWVDLVTATEGTSIVFEGKQGHTYYFRARATDRAGNVETFSEDPADFARVEISDQAISIAQPITLVAIALVIAIIVTTTYYLYKRKGL